MDSKQPKGGKVLSSAYARPPAKIFIWAGVMWECVRLRLVVVVCLLGKEPRRYHSYTLCAQCVRSILMIPLFLSLTNERRARRGAKQDGYARPQLPQRQHKMCLFWALLACKRQLAVCCNDDDA